MNIMKATKTLVTLGVVTVFMGAYVLKSHDQNVEDDADEDFSTR